MLILIFIYIRYVVDNLIVNHLMYFTYFYKECATTSVKVMRIFSIYYLVYFEHNYLLLQIIELCNIFFFLCAFNSSEFDYSSTSFIWLYLRFYYNGCCYFFLFIQVLQSLDNLTYMRSQYCQIIKKKTRHFLRNICIKCTDINLIDNVRFQWLVIMERFNLYE